MLLNKRNIKYVLPLISMSVATASGAESVDVGGITITPSVMAGIGYVYNQNQAFGSTVSSIGLPVDQDSNRVEGAIKPSLLFNTNFSESSFGQLFGGISAVAAFNEGSTDGSGLEAESVGSAALDDYYIGWDLSESVSGMGVSNLKLSYGNQSLLIGDGFLVGDGHTDQGNDGGYWMGYRTAFDDAILLEADFGSIHTDVFRGTTNNDIDAYNYKDRLTLSGANIEWQSEQNSIGAMYLKTSDDDVESRDNLNVSNLRATFSPTSLSEDLLFSFGFVNQEKNSTDNKAWYAGAKYTFSSTQFTPSISYRRTNTSAGYDALTYGYMGEWGTWFQGEIVGEYMLFNSNQIVDKFEISAFPTEAIRTGLIYYSTSLDEPVLTGSSTDFSDEYNVYIDWYVNQNTIFNALVGYAEPKGAATDLYGNNESSYLFEVAATFIF